MEYQRLHSTELLLPIQAAAGSPPATQGCRSTGQTCQGARGEGLLGTFPWWKAGKEALQESSPFLPLPTPFCTRHGQSVQTNTTHSPIQRPFASSFEVLRLVQNHSRHAQASPYVSLKTTQNRSNWKCDFNKPLSL